MFYKAISWNEFIREIARQKLSSEKLRLTFIDTFGDNESPKIDKTVEGHLREIYKRFESECPGLTNAKKGKKEILRGYLQTLYANQRDFTGISDRPQSPTNPQNIPTRESIPELTTLEFIGRDRDLTNLANLRRQAKIVLIKAGAGVGKSTLAREFLQTQFKKVIRIEMGLESGNVTPAEEKVSQILRKDFDEEPSRDFGINLDILREKLVDRANPMGVLIDNLEPALDENYRFREKLRGYDALLAVLGDRDVFSFTLITSRRSLIAPRARVHEYSLEGLDITAWRQYFHDCENGADSEALLQMCVAYNGNAKVMDILHSAIKNRFDGNIAAYWSRYKDALLADSELETLISVEMDWLRDNQLDAYKLLCRMGCYRYQDVKTVPFEGLICLLWDVAESRKACIIDYLSKTSLIEVKGEYYLHPTVRHCTKSSLLKNKTDWETAHIKAAEFWISKVKLINTPNDMIVSFEAYYHHLENGDFENAGNVIVRPVNNAGLTLGALFYRTGLCEQMIFAINRIIMGIDNGYLRARLFNSLGNQYWAFGSLHKSIECHRKSGEISRLVQNKSLSLNHLTTLELISTFNLGICKFALWEIKESIDLFKKVLYFKEHFKYLNDDYKEPLTSKFFICLLRSYLGDKEIAYYLTNIIDHNTRDKAGSWHYVIRLLLIGLIYTNLGETEKATEYYQNCILFANDFSFFQIKGKALTGAAEICRIKNNLNIAVSKHAESIDLLYRIGAKCDLAEAYFQLGLTYRVMEEHDQAEEYKAKALELFEQMEAPKQIDRVNKAFEQGAIK